MAMDAFSASLMKDKREIVIAPTIYKLSLIHIFSAALQRKFNFLEPIDRFRMTSPSKAVKVSIVTKL